MQKFDLQETKIINSKVFEDERGFFLKVITL